MKLIDSFGRRIDYLRLSITDRCNLRCTYCMPADGVEKLGHHDMLTYEELLRVATEAVSLGVRKIRVTGGEPLVRKGLPEFLRQLAALPGLREVVLTTNGILLEPLAAELWGAGVRRLNVSLDSLRPQVFARISRGGDLRRVLAGIEAAERAGFPPVKLNMVVMRGVNDEEILDFAALTLESRRTVRFIEYMPATGERGWERLLVPGKEILERLGRRYTVLPAVRGEMAGPARNFRIAGAAGSIGIITAVSGHFCDACNRIRVTASGSARSCLFAGGGVDLKPVLRGGDAWELRRVLREVVEAKPGRHHIGSDDGPAFAMSAIGG